MIISDETKIRMTAWWEHEDMDRPCFLCRFAGKQDKSYDTDDIERHWTDVDYIIGREMYSIDNYSYLFEAVPYHYIDLGAVPLGGCLGGDLKLIDKRTTWNVPFIDKLEDILNLDVTRYNKWWGLIKSITEKSVVRANNHHYVAYPAFSGITDIISSIYGLEPFLCELVDNPGGIKRVSAHILDIWIRLFKELGNDIDKSGNDGYVGGWPGVWSPGRSFPLQEDISYMLSKEMFDEFCLPYIDALAQILKFPYYHLDGKGAVKFIDSLIGIEKLKVIQWIPGEGTGELSQWHDMIKYVIDHGKSMHIYAREEEVIPLIKAVGRKGLLISTDLSNISNMKKIVGYDMS